MHLDRVARWLARRPRRCRYASRASWSCVAALTRTTVELDRELAQRTSETAPALPGCGAITAAKLLAEIGPIGRFQTDAQLARHLLVYCCYVHAARHDGRRLSLADSAQPSGLQAKVSRLSSPPRRS